MRKSYAVFLPVCMVVCTIFSGCTPDSGKDAFSNWVEGATPIAELREYVETVTDEKSEDFIPAEDRIAVFDLDGTLYCETFPIYGKRLDSNLWRC